MNDIPLFYSYDIETLDTKPNSPIIEIGLCAVDHSAHNGFSFKTNSIVLGAPEKANVSTVMFHCRTESGRELLMQSMGINASLNISLITTFFRETGAYSSGVFAKWFMRGPAFDQTITETLLDTFNCRVPWQYSNVLCQRTIDNLVPRDTLKAQHRAGYDAEQQARRVIEVYSVLFGDDPERWGLRQSLEEPSVPDTPGSLPDAESSAGLMNAALQAQSTDNQSAQGSETPMPEDPA